MQHYWQRRPLLIRQALRGPEARPPLQREALFALAERDDVESRLVGLKRGRWTLEHGPIPPDAWPRLSKRQWTLLVQGVDLHDDAARALLQRFRFIPDARLDDLMISYATDGGGVGPHVDSYDVFLLQVEGKRRWRIGRQRKLELLDDAPLKVLSNFTPEHEYLLEPGDMLYLPPQIAHEGVAIGNCMTCSIGFRAPTKAELVTQFCYELAERAGNMRNADQRYSDPGEAATRHPGKLPDALLKQVGAILAEITWTAADVAAFVGRYSSEPKASVFFEPPARPRSITAFLQRAVKNGVVLDRKSVLLYESRLGFINGEAFSIRGKLAKAVRRLADNRALMSQDFVTLAHDSAMTTLLYEWYCAGWIRVPRPAGA